MKRTIITGLLPLGALLLGATASAQEQRSAEEAAAAEQPAALLPDEQTQTTTEETRPNLVSETPERLWDIASTAYINGNYHEAVEAYEELAARGLSSAKLYYNLANACFKEEQLGRAILFYRRALRIDPGSVDARYNLSVAEARTKDSIEQVPEFFLTSWFRAIRQAMNCTVWSILSLVSLACGLGAILLCLLAQRLSWRKTGFYGALAALTFFFVTTCFAAGERRSILDRSEAVVMSSSASVKSAPDRSATDLFVLHEGTSVRITDRLDPWCEVTIADGKKGWVESSKIETI